MRDRPYGPSWREIAIVVLVAVLIGVGVTAGLVALMWEVG